jgi:hypothetical protein
MANREKHHGARDHGERERLPEREHKDRGDDPLRHAQIIQRRWLGSPPPTFEQYARALRQWQSLPGAVVRPATMVIGEQPLPSGTGRTSGSGEGRP